MKESGPENEAPAETLVFKIGELNLSLLTEPASFVPNSTTSLLFELALPVRGLEVLDLGCGVGPIAIASALSGAKGVTAIDVKKEACSLTRKNACINGVEDRVNVIEGFLFRDLRSTGFDLIVSDVSGMSEATARISPWYPEPIPTGGITGTDLAIEVIQTASTYLKPSGRLVFPVLSLSKASDIELAAQAVFGNTLTLLLDKWIPLPNELRGKLPFLEEQRKKGIIDFALKGSRLCWNLKIYSGEC